MELIFSLLFWLLILMFVVLWFRKKIRRMIEAETALAEEEKEIRILPEYRIKRRVLNASEASFYYLLEKELGDDFFIFPNMRIADVLETVKGDGYKVRRNKILPKHIDFLICDLQFRPLLAIELDGKYHNNDAQIEKDRRKDEIFKKAGLPLRRVVVGSDFQEEVEKISTVLQL